MSTRPLSIDVYISPMRPYNYPDQLGEGEVATWAPSSSTLISGPTEGILIDALLTFNNADEIAAWAKGFGKTITGIYITHGHSDHWLGLARLLEHFPEARGYAAPEVEGRAAWEAEFNKTTKYWTSRFPGELPETPVVPAVPARLHHRREQGRLCPGASPWHARPARRTRPTPHALDLSPSGSRSPGVNDLDWAVSPDGSTIRPLTAADQAAFAELPDRVSSDS